MLSTLYFISCDSEDPEVPNEEELITTLIMEFQPEGGGSVVTFSFRDLDGDGGESPTVSTSALLDSTTYEVSIQLFSEIETPVEDITEEVIEENLEHQFFYALSPDVDAEISYNDLDDSGNPLGVETILKTLGASAGTLTVTLRHEPDKNASGVADGDISNAGGETDIEVSFDLVIE